MPKIYDDGKSVKFIKNANKYLFFKINGNDLSKFCYVASN